jgi:hypothetical protein
MSRLKPRPEVAWTITLTTTGATEYIGRVYALDQQKAIAKAIKGFAITGPWRVKRLMVRRAG